MTLCNKPITRKSRDGKEDITPTLAYRCELRLGEDDAPHEGPCSNPSDPVSRDQRIHWERTHAREQAVKRHAASGLGQTQSIPLSSASITESDDIKERYNPALKVGRKHPAEPVDCPFCDQQPMAKELLRHIQANHTTPALDAYEEAWGEDADLPEWDTPVVPVDPTPGHKTGDVSRDLIAAIPMPPQPTRPEKSVLRDTVAEQAFLDATVISAWFVRNVEEVPLTVREAWGRISSLFIK